MSTLILPKLKKDKEIILSFKTRSDSLLASTVQVIMVDSTKGRLLSPFFYFNENHEDVEIPKGTIIDLTTFTNSFFEPQLHFCLTSTEIFQMRTHLTNGLKVWKDLKYVQEKVKHYKKCLETQSFVREGTNKLEAWDHKNLEWILYGAEKGILFQDYKSPFSFQVGQQLTLQNDKQITVLFRSYLKGYECIMGSDGKARYDRSTNKEDTGRCTGTHIAYISPYNIAVPSRFNMYKKALAFSEKHGYDFEDVFKNTGNMYPPRTKIDKQFHAEVSACLPHYYKREDNYYIYEYSKNDTRPDAWLEVNCYIFNEKLLKRIPKIFKRKHEGI